MNKTGECVHNKTETHKHRRKNYPFGKKSKAIHTSVKKITIHCKKCKTIIEEYKV